MNINLKDWKKSHSTKDYSTFVHKNGSELRVAHGALSAKMREQLAALKPMGKDAEDTEQAAESDAEGKQKFAKGGKVVKPKATKLFADGGEAESTQDSPDQIAADAAAAAPSPAPQAAPASPPVVVNVNSGPTPQQAPQPSIASIAKGGEDAPQGSSYGMEQAEQAAKEDAPPQGTPSGSVPPPALPGGGMGAQPSPTPNGSPMGGFADNMVGGYNKQVAGINQQAAAQGQEGAADSQVLGQQADTDKMQQQLYQNFTNQNLVERQRFVQDYQDQHINPNQVFDNMNGFQKALAGIGLLLGGVAGQGKSNPAMDFLNQQIDRNIAAQQSELGKRHSLLQNNLDHFKNINDAALMTRMQYNDLYSHLISQQAAKAKGPMAQGAAQQAIGELQQKNAMYMGMMGQGGIPGQSGGDDQTSAMLNQMRVINPDRAKEIEGRYVPGVGVGSVPVPADARSNILAKQTFGNMVSDFSKWASQHSGVIKDSPENAAVINEGKAKAAEIQSLYRQSIQGGVFKKGEQEFIDNIIDSDPTKFFNNIRVLPKLKAVMNSNDQQLNAIKKSYGLPQQSSASPQAAGKSAKIDFKAR